MNKKTIILVSSIIGILLILAFTVYFIYLKHSNELNANKKVTITKYDDGFNIEKTVELDDKKQINEIHNIFKKIDLVQKEELSTKLIKNEVKIELDNNIFIMIELDISDYCYYEDPNTDTKLIIEMPNGLLDIVKNVINK